MVRYVLSYEKDQWGYVYLVRKKKPEWQKGLLNLPGGHVEDGESPYEAAVREHREEIGRDTIMSYRGKLVGPDWEISIYGVLKVVKMGAPIADEEVLRIPFNHLGMTKDIIPNVPLICGLCETNSHEWILNYETQRKFTFEI